MNLPTKLIALSVLVVAGTAWGQITSDSQMSPDQQMNQGLNGGLVRQRTWAYGVTLREGYDSNYTTSPYSHGSFTTTVSPDGQFAWSNADTDLAMHYAYSAVYYQTRPGSQVDQSHDFSFNLNHEFSSRLHVNFYDEFVPGFEPDISIGTYQRSADYIQNTTKLSATYMLNSRMELSTSVSYFFIKYDDSSNLGAIPGLPVSTILNRQTYDVSEQFRYRPDPTTSIGLAVGYQDTSYEGLDRSNSGNYFDLVFIRNFTPRLMLNATAGASLQTFNVVGGTQVNPDVSMTLIYMATSRASMNMGFSTRVQPTELTSYLATQTFMFNGGLVYQFTPKLMGSLSAAFAPSFYNSSLIDPQTGASTTATQEEDLISGSAMLGYQFTVHLRGEVGYTFMHFTSDFAGRAYDRHMTYLQARLGF
jgi:Putative beta-barrel porin 2